LNKFLEENSQPELAETVKRVINDLDRILSHSDDLKKTVSAVSANGSFEPDGVAEIESIFDTAARASEDMKAIFKIKEKYQL
jgi:hypothetical protein